jgi:hypothetical protein
MAQFLTATNIGVAIDAGGSAVSARLAPAAAWSPLTRSAERSDPHDPPRIKAQPRGKPHGSAPIKPLIHDKCGETRAKGGGVVPVGQDVESARVRWRRSCDMGMLRRQPSREHARAFQVGSQRRQINVRGTMD